MPNDGDAAEFVNSPLFDIQVRYRDGGSGETMLDAALDCDNPAGTDDTSDTTQRDDTLTVTGIEVPAAGTITIQCTLIVDPLTRGR